MKPQKRINELLGSEGPIKLSQLNGELAKAAAAPQAGTKDGNPNDDKAKVNTKSMVTVGALSPAQKEVIPMKALSFALGYLSNKDPNLDEMDAIVSSDMYIMDGHHRWAAATLVDPNKKVKVAKIEMPAVDLITALNVYTKGALGKPGNTGAGDLESWQKLIKSEIEKAFINGFSEEQKNAILPGGKPNWPMFAGGKGKTAEEVKKLFGMIPGAKGNAEKGKEIMISNSLRLKTTKLPQAPERIDMPVIEAGEDPQKVKTNDIEKSQLYDVCTRIANGTLDLKEPYTKGVSSKLGGNKAESAPKETEKAQESRTIKTYEKFIQNWKKN
jgi:hypothetical protein